MVLFLCKKEKKILLMKRSEVVEESIIAIKNSIEVLNQNDLMEMFAIKRTTLFKLLKADILPVVKMGKNYYTTQTLMEEWFAKMQGHEIFW